MSEHPIPEEKSGSLTVDDLAQRHKVSTNFIRAEIRRGHLRALILSRGNRKKLRILPEQERAWLDLHANTQPE